MAMLDHNRAIRALGDELSRLHEGRMVNLNYIQHNPDILEHIDEPTDKRLYNQQVADIEYSIEILEGHQEW